jgi:parallel beta-helix repeat protein
MPAPICIMPSTFSFRSVAVLSFIALSIVGALAQGTLTPPGAPAPVMKTLSQIEPRTLISSLPVTITNSGSYYLSNNLRGVSGAGGITIATNNVTIDLNGFALVGVPGSQKGISTLGSLNNIIVRNGSLSDWGGTAVDGSGGSPLRNGILEHLTVSSNGGYGITISGNCLIQGCLSQSNVLDGISCSHCVVSDCVVKDNGNYGFTAYYSHLRDCHAQNNVASGIYLQYSDAEGCKADNCANGIFVLSGTVSRCDAQNNTYTGIYIDGPGSVVTGNVCFGNNAGLSSVNAGITIRDSNNRLEGNHVTANGYAGILVTGPYAGNVIIKNSVAGNGANNYLVPTPANDLGPVGKAATATSPWANISN